MTRALLRVALLALSAAPSLQHSLLTCSDYRPPGSDIHSADGDQFCFGRPRGWRLGVIDTHHLECLVYRPGNGGHSQGAPAQFGSDCYKNWTSQNVGGFTCDQAIGRRTTPFSTAYDTQYPYAIYKPGRVVCLEWPGMNHVFGEDVNGTVTGFSTGTVRVSGAKANKDSDPSQADLNKGDKWDLPYDNCAPTTDSRLGRYLTKSDIANGRARPCRGCFTIPATWTDGLYVFQWLWQLNSDEWYSTCWDAVVSSAAPDYNLTIPDFAGFQRNFSGVTAAAGAKWKAPPIGADVGNLQCPPGLDGPLCTPTGGPSPWAPPAGSREALALPPPAPPIPVATDPPVALPANLFGDGTVG